jgi:transcription antitermination factor NusG
MPILSRTVDLYPHDLFDREDLGTIGDSRWWALYTLSRREKDLMQRLRALKIPFYGPTIEKHYRSPAGRFRTSYIPLFANYVFLYGDDLQRYDAQSTNCVSRYVPIVQGEQLTRDLRQIYELIQAGVPLTPEARLQPGRRVRVRTGTFRGHEGIIIRREGKTRLLVAVNFLQQGASLQLEDCEVEYLDWTPPGHLRDAS